MVGTAPLGIEARMPRREEISELEILETQARNEAQFVNAGALYFLKLLGKHKIFAPTLRKEVHQLTLLLQLRNKIEKHRESAGDTPALQDELKKAKASIQRLQSTLREHTGKIDNHLGILVEKMKLLQGKEKSYLEGIILETANVSPEDKKKVIELKNKIQYVLKKLFLFFQKLREDYGQFHQQLGTLLSRFLQEEMNESERYNSESEIHALITQMERSLKNVLIDAEKVALEDKVLARMGSKEKVLVLKILDKIHTAPFRVTQTNVGRTEMEL